MREKKKRRIKKTKIRTIEKNKIRTTDMDGHEVSRRLRMKIEVDVIGEVVGGEGVGRGGGIREKTIRRGREEEKRLKSDLHTNQNGAETCID